MNTGIAILSSTTVVALITAIITGLFSKRKLSADATAILTQAAGGLVERLVDENKRINDRNDRLTGRVEELERQMASWSAVVVVHQEWDRSAARELRNNGINIGDPPPLKPLLAA